MPRTILEDEDSTTKVIFGDSANMEEVEDNSVHLIVTSPPYWENKDYGDKEQTGFGQLYSEYLESMQSIWDECRRVLHPGCKICINIGDRYLSTKYHGRYRVISIASDIYQYFVNELEVFDFMGDTIWQKISNCNPTGGATVMGSYPNPRNGIPEYDYEHILVFKLRGKQPPLPSKEEKKESSLTLEEWREFFTGHWNFPGAKQGEHPAMFPEELPRRLIRMYSFKGDVVLDPFVGSGTTLKVARDLGRQSIGYEISEKYMDVIKEKVFD